MMNKNVEEFLNELKFEIELVGKKYLNKEDKTVHMGDGSKNPSFLFIGDDIELLSTEDNSLEISSSGEFLYKILELENISSNDFYVTTITKRRAKFSEFSDEDREMLEQYLKLHISLLSPSIIILLGSVASSVFFKDEDFEKLRGSFKEINKTTFLVSHDVANVMKARNEIGKKAKIANEFWNDIRKIRNFNDDEE